VVEVARLESVYRFIAYPGFESPSLRQEQELSNKRSSENVRRRPKKAALAPATAAFFVFWFPRPSACILSNPRFLGV
jgi:hypothetical protein